VFERALLLVQPAELGALPALHSFHSRPVGFPEIHRICGGIVEAPGTCSRNPHCEAPRRTNRRRSGHRIPHRKDVHRFGSSAESICFGPRRKDHQVTRILAGLRVVSRACSSRRPVSALSRPDCLQSAAVPRVRQPVRRLAPDRGPQQFGRWYADRRRGARRAVSR
jgi:hypothetical protein